MANDLEHSRVEQLKRDLHKLGAQTAEEQLHTLHQGEYGVARDFSDATIAQPHAQAQQVPKYKPPVPTSMKLLRAFALFALLSALCAFGYFGYQFVDPATHPSPENIVLTIDVPPTATPGAPVDIVVHVTNKNIIALETADVVVGLPAGVYSKQGGDILPLHEAKAPLGMVTSGQTGEFRIRAYILGEEGQSKSVKATVNYRFINMAAQFTKSIQKDVKVLASPVTLSFDSLKKVAPGQDFDTTISVRSNTEVPLRDLLVSADYPLGFVVKNTTPRPLSEQNLWSISTLSPSDVATIVINGMLTSEGGDDRIVTASVGATDISSSHDIASRFQQVSNTVSIEKPFIGTAIAFNDVPSVNAVARFGVEQVASLTVRNDSPTTVKHAVVHVTISGTGFDPSSVQSLGGVYRAAENSITWDERSIPDLAEIMPGKSVSLSFRFVPSAARDNGQFVQNPQIVTDVSVSASREDISGVATAFTSLGASVLRVASKTDFAARALHYSGALVDGGVEPPQVDQPTQYTVEWSIHNSSNALSNVTIKTELPPQVVWSGLVDPSDANIHFDPVSHSVTWTIPTVPAGAGVGSVPPLIGSFQVVLTPTRDQVGQSAPLTGRQEFAGTDVFTGQPVSVSLQALSTYLESDPKAPEGYGRVTAPAATNN